MSDFIPSSDANALLWLQAFANGIAANFATYQLVLADSTTISNAVNDYAAALALATANATRTSSTIIAKDAARESAEAVVRQFAILIKYNDGISDEAKNDIGVRPVNPSKSPINVPDSSPLLNILGATPGSQTLRFSDTSTPDTPAKPFGASQLLLFVAIKDEITDNEDDAKFIGLYSRNPVAVGFVPEDDGKMATYFARWCDLKGQTGPWSLPVSMRIAA